MPGKTIRVVALSHDLDLKKSFVSFIWTDDPTKRLGLEVPFGTELDGVEAAAKSAISAFRDEMAEIAIVMP
jgi:hypothetical protein